LPDPRTPNQMTRAGDFPFVQQARGPLDVSEEQGDAAGWKLVRHEHDHPRRQTSRLVRPQAEGLSPGRELPSAVRAASRRASPSSDPALPILRTPDRPSHQCVRPVRLAPPGPSSRHKWGRLVAVRHPHRKYGAEDQAFACASVLSPEPRLPSRSLTIFLNTRAGPPCSPDRGALRSSAQRKEKRDDGPADSLSGC